MAVCVEMVTRELATTWHFLEHREREGAMAEHQGMAEHLNQAVVSGQLEKQKH